MMDHETTSNKILYVCRMAGPCQYYIRLIICTSLVVVEVTVNMTNKYN